MLTYLWSASPAFDVMRVLHTYTALNRGFFSRHNFLVFPMAYGDAVYLPDISYEGIWVPHDLAPIKVRYRAQDIKRISNRLADYPMVHTPISLDKIRDEFDNVNTSFNKLLISFFPDTASRIRTIQVVSTAYGTVGSFTHTEKENGYELTIWVRTTGLDVQRILGNLVHCIVSAIVVIETHINDDLTNRWEQREAVVDFLMSHTAFAKIVPGVKTLSSLSNTQWKVHEVQDSHAFLRKLGVMNAAHIDQTDRGYLINGISLETLTEKENLCFKILLAKRGAYVTKDELAEEVFEDGAGSDWAMAKLIERIRKKMKIAGIPYPPIISSRKRGYLLDVYE